MTSKESLIEEILANARKDRTMLESVAEGLLKNIQETSVSGEEDLKVDPEVAAAFAEQLTDVSEALTKINHELVELVKMERKQAAVPNKLDKDELESAYDEIQPQEEPDGQLLS